MQDQESYQSKLKNFLRKSRPFEEAQSSEPSLSNFKPSKFIKKLQQYCQILKKQNINSIATDACNFFINRPNFSSLPLQQKQHTLLQFKKEHISQKISEQNKKLIELFFKLLINFSTAKNYPSISSLFLILLSKNCLSSKQINYAFFIGIVCSEYIALGENYNQITFNYRIINSQLTTAHENFFYFAAMVIYLGRSKEKEDEDIVKGILKRPNFISEILKAYHSFPQQEISFLTKNFLEMPKNLIDNFLMKVLFTLLTQQKYKDVRDRIRYIIKCIMRAQLSILTLKNLLKKLEIGEQKCELKNRQKWKELFHLMEVSMQNFPNTKKIIHLETSSSIIIPLSKKYKQIQMSFKSFESQKQLILFSIAGKKEQLVFSIRKNQFNITDKYPLYTCTFLRLKQNISCQMTKLQVKWQQFEEESVKCILKADRVSILIRQDAEYNKNKELQFQICPQQFIVGDHKYQIGTFSHQITEMSILIDNQQYNVITFLENPKLNKDTPIQFNKVNSIIKQSFVSLIRSLGDLDLFFLTISHLIKKISNKEILVEMMSSVMNFMESFVILKGVKKNKLTQEENEKRTSNILCLCWSITHHKRGSLPIFELLRFLKIRQNYNVSNLLNLLCNFVLWKQFSKLDHHLIIQKIKELCEQSQIKEERMDFVKICKVIIFDLVIFYNNTKIMSEQQQKQYLYKQADLLDLIFSKVTSTNNQFYILELLQFLVKIMYSLIDRTRQNEFVDMTIGLQISALLVNLGQHLFDNRQNLYTKKQENKFWQDKVKVMINDVGLWTLQIIECLQNEILFIQGNQITYYDWKKCKYEQSTENSIRVNTYTFYVYLISYSPITLFQFIQRKYLKMNILTVQLLWKVNFIENNSIQSIKNTLLQYSLLQEISDQNSDQLIKDIVIKYSKISHKIYIFKFILEKMLIASPKSFIIFLQQLYQQQEDPNKSLVCERILQFLVAIPTFNYTNSKKLLSVMYQFDRNKKTIEIVTTNLIIKELSTQVAKLMEHRQSFSSTIMAIDQSFTSQSSHENSEDQHLTISGPQVLKCLSQIQLLAQVNEIKKFYQSNEQDLESHVQNFQINLKIIIEIFQLQNAKDRINKLKKTIFFIQNHIYPFSQMIIYDYIFPQSLQKKNVKDRKKSLQIQQFDKIRKQSSALFESFLKQRRKNLLKIQKFWNKVEKNNKYFWEIFISQQKKHQSIDKTVNKLNARMLIKIDNKKREIQLPKMVISGSIKITASLDSDKELKNEDGESESSIFSDVNYYRQDSYSDKEEQQNRNTLSKLDEKYKFLQKKNQCSVFYITNTFIYQGILEYENDKIWFIQNQEPSDLLYDAICANDNERRSIYKIQKDKEMFQIKINKYTTIIPKRYIYYQVGLQIFSQHKSYFFSFRKKRNRQIILQFYSHLRGTISSQNQLRSIVKIQTERWIKGQISNFTYLMHLNNLSSRSFNDVSQYYIFPWTVSNFNQKIDKNFLKNKNNFRDLSKSVGCLNEKRFKEIQNKYKQNIKFSDIEPFLFGSFYSNPAIVCNYLVRLQPFSLNHYFLQSKKFDLADRIFHSISDQFNSCLNNLFDYKQLIPQFYFYPEFLRNRSTYDFGYKQNKQLVNNVSLPKWSLQNPQIFIFNMRKCLQSPVVTKNLNQWIDLVFGIYNTKQRGLQKNNLFAHTVYKNQLSKSQNKKDRQSCLIFYKEFGQVPKTIFSEPHPIFNCPNFQFQLSNQNISTIQKKVQMAKLILEETYFMYFDIVSHQLSLCSSINNNGFDKKKIGHPIYNINIMVFHSQSKRIPLLIYSHLSRLIIRQIHHSSLLFKKPQIKQEITHELSKKINPQIITIFEQLNMIIIVQSLTISFYTLHQQKAEENVGVLSVSKKNIYFKEHLKFTQHRSSIVFVKVCKENGLLISLDSCRKVFIIKLNTQIQVSQSFRLTKLSHCEEVKDIRIHGMCYIIFLTSLNYIYIYNFMGDLITQLNPSSVSLLESQQKIQCFEIWNSQASQIVLGTSKGRIIKLDWFQGNSEENKAISISEHPIRQLLMHRIGRYWRLYISTSQEVKKIETARFTQNFKESIEYSKKTVLQYI